LIFYFLWKYIPIVIISGGYKLSQVCVIFVALKAGMCRIKTIVRSARSSGEIRLAESRVIGWDDACGDVVGCRPANPVVSGELGQSGAVDEPAQDQHRLPIAAQRPPPISRTSATALGGQETGHEQHGGLPDREHGGVTDRIGHAHDLGAAGHLWKDVPPTEVLRSFRSSRRPRRFSDPASPRLLGMAHCPRWLPSPDRSGTRVRSSSSAGPATSWPTPALGSRLRSRSARWMSRPGGTSSRTPNRS
jgi:hypothetical protein